MDGQTMQEVFGEPISTYTRAQAIADGVLIDVTEHEITRDARIGWPVAFTVAAWAWVKPVPSCQGQNGRLWDVYTMLRYAIRDAPPEGSFGRLRFSVLFRGGQKRRVEFRATIDGDATNQGRDANLTIMLPGED